MKVERSSESPPAAPPPTVPELPPEVLAPVVRLLREPRPSDLLAFMLTCRACYDFGLPFLLEDVSFGANWTSFPAFAEGYLASAETRRRLREVKKIRLNPILDGAGEVLRECLSLESLAVIIELGEDQHAGFSETELDAVPPFFDLLPSLCALQHLTIGTLDASGAGALDMLAGKRLPPSLATVALFIVDDGDEGSGSTALMRLLDTAPALESWGMYLGFADGVVDLSPFPGLAGKLRWWRSEPALFSTGDPAALAAFPRTLRRLELDDTAGDLTEEESIGIVRDAWNLVCEMNDLELLRLVSFPSSLFLRGCPRRLKVLQLEDPVPPTPQDADAVREALRTAGARRIQVGFTDDDEETVVELVEFWRTVPGAVVAAGLDAIEEVFPCWAEEPLDEAFAHGCDCSNCS